MAGVLCLVSGAPMLSEILGVLLGIMTDKWPGYSEPEAAELIPFADVPVVLHAHTIADTKTGVNRKEELFQYTSHQAMEALIAAAPEREVQTKDKTCGLAPLRSRVSGS